MDHSEIALSFSVSQLLGLKVCLDFAYSTQPPSVYFEAGESTSSQSSHPDICGATVKLDSMVIDGRKIVRLYATDASNASPISSVGYPDELVPNSQSTSIYYSPDASFCSTVDNIVPDAGLLPNVDWNAMDENIAALQPNAYDQWLYVQSRDTADVHYSDSVCNFRQDVRSMFPGDRIDHSLCFSPNYEHDTTYRENFGVGSYPTDLSSALSAIGPSGQPQTEEIISPDRWRLASPSIQYTDSSYQTKDGEEQAKRPAKRNKKTTPQFIYHCPYPSCTRVFRSEYTCRVHSGVHIPKPRKIVPCTVSSCEETFTRQHDRLRHEVSQHGKVCDWSCVTCKRFFSSAETLQKHKCNVFKRL